MVEILKCTESVYRKFPGQSGPQPAFLELDPATSRIWAGYSGDIGNSVPSNVWHRRILRFRIDPLLAEESINNLMEEALPLCDRIIAGWRDVWNGSRYYGELTEDAENAEEELIGLCDTAVGTYDGVLDSFDDERLDLRLGDLTGYADSDLAFDFIMQDFKSYIVTLEPVDLRYWVKDQLLDLEDSVTYLLNGWMVQCVAEVF